MMAGPCDRQTAIEEVYHDLDRVADVLGLMIAAPTSYSEGAVELVQGKVLDLARRLEALVRQ